MTNDGIEALIDPDTNLPTAYAYDLDSGLPGSYTVSEEPMPPPSSPSACAGQSNGSPNDASVSRRSQRRQNPPPSQNSTVAPANTNLSEAQKELLRWHFRLGHLNLRAIQFLMRSGALANSEAMRRLHRAASAVSPDLKCTACLYAKQRLRSAPGQTTAVVRDRVDALRRDNLFPGQRISVDHFVCSTKGRLFASRGKTKETELFTGGCVFVDHASGYVHVELQKHLNTDETLLAKEAYELMCRDVGVIPQEYLSDNGAAFTSQGFSKHLTTFQQVSKFAGVGAHHHNGIAERTIQTIMSIARAMLIHQAIHWPDVADVALWPMVTKHAVYLWIKMPSLRTGLCPQDLFTRTRWPHSKFHDIHVWGCPVYVLDKKIADGQKLPRWQARSHRCIYVGMSDAHASTVPLVLNPSTGAITPQFHVVFDDWFATVSVDQSQLPDFYSPEWYTLFGDSAYQYIPLDREDEELAAANAPDTSVDHSRADIVRAAFETHSPSIPLPVAPPAELPTAPTLPTASMPATSFDGSLQRETQAQEQVSPERELTPAPAPPTVLPEQPPNLPPQRETPAIQEVAPLPNVELQREIAPRRSARSSKPPSMLTYDHDGQQVAANFSSCFAAIGIAAPAVYKAAASDPDTLTWEQAMRDYPHVEHWQAAADSEIQSLEEKGTWTEVPKSDAQSKILPGTWVFRRKRSPDGTIKKYKARYCVRGDLQEGEFETYAPVAAWSTIRLLLILALNLNWYACTTDFASAFVQATLKTPVWIHLPRGFHANKGDMCLRLKKSLYGLTVAPRLWFEHLKSALVKLGLKQSCFDPCLFYGRDLIMCCFVDDTVYVAKSSQVVDAFIAKLRAMGFELTKEDSLYEYLGIKMERNERDGTIKLSQPGLIDKILHASNLANSNPNQTPTTLVALGSDPHGPPMQETWGYSSIVGMLLYLSINTRPDIAFAVSQAARFNASPKQSHAQAVKHIVRYLKGTRTLGTIIKPIGALVLDLFVDADFAGLHRREPDEVPDSVRSRTGYIILLSGCPLLWKSKLQTEISLSTLEAEYSALSFALKTLLPLKRLLCEVITTLDVPSPLKTSIRARASEDNQGAYYLATNQRLTNRTKYFLVKFHWFWSHFNRGEFEMHQVATTEQLADYLTKGLPRDSFLKNRLAVQRN